MLTRRRWQVEGAGGSGTLFVGEVKVDHGRGNIGVAENVLHGADVGIGFEEVGREATTPKGWRCFGQEPAHAGDVPRRGEAAGGVAESMTEGVAGDAFGDRGLFDMLSRRKSGWRGPGEGEG